MEDSKTGSRLAVCHLQAMERNKRERPLQGRCSSRNFGSAVSMPSAAQHWLAGCWFLEQSPAKAKHRAMMPWKWHVVGGWSGVSVGGPQGLWLRRTRPVLMVSVDLQRGDARPARTVPMPSSSRVHKRAAAPTGRRTVLCDSTAAARALCFWSWRIVVVLSDLHLHTRASD